MDKSEIISFSEYAKFSTGSNKDVDEMLFDYVNYCRVKVVYWKTKYEDEVAKNSRNTKERYWNGVYKEYTEISNDGC